MIFPIWEVGGNFNCHKRFHYKKQLCFIYVQVRDFVMKNFGVITYLRSI